MTASSEGTLVVVGDLGSVTNHPAAGGCTGVENEPVTVIWTAVVPVTTVLGKMDVAVNWRGVVLIVIAAEVLVRAKNVVPSGE